MIITSNLNEARKQIQKFLKDKQEGKLKPEETAGVLGQDDEFNRKALEIKNLKMLIINENLNQKDYMKQRNSGLNEVLAKICADKKIELGIQIDEIIKKDSIEKARSLARLQQNIMLCKKAGCKLKLISIQDKKAAQSLLLTLGASSKQAEEAIKL